MHGKQHELAEGERETHLSVVKYEQTSLVPAVVFFPPGVVLCQAVVVFLPSLMS